MTRYKIWNTDKSFNGEYVHDISIPAIDDLYKFTVVRSYLSTMFTWTMNIMFYIVWKSLFEIEL